MNRLYKRMSLGLLFLFACLSGLLNWYYFPTNQTSYHPSVTAVVDTYFNDVTYKQFNSSGFLVMILKSPHATMNKKTTRLYAISPRITAYSKKGKPWFIQAKHMESDTKTHITKLTGSVRIFQPATKTDPSTTITTSEVTLYPNDKIVTKAHVIIVQSAGNHLEGNGCIINLQSNTMTLLADTKATLQP